MTSRRTFLGTSMTGSSALASALRGASFIGSLATATAALAQAYPARPIRLVTPSPPGGGADVTNRIIARHLSDLLGQQIVVDNKVGGNGVIAAMDALRSEKDGYTIFLGSTTTLVANPYLMKTMNYDPAADFAPVSLIGTLPFVVVVNPALPIRSIKELIAYAKVRPGQVSFASANSTSLVAASMFARITGIGMLNVPYKSAPASLSDVASGQVAISFVDVPSSRGLIQSGKLRVLGITSDRRFPSLPDVPTIAEAGVPGYELVGWTAMTMAAGTDPAIVRRLSDETRKVLARADVQEQFLNVGVVATSSTPEQLGAFMRTERPRWARLIRNAGIQPE